MQCKVANCERIVIARGLCRRHYARYKKYGDPTAGRDYGQAEQYYQEVVLHHRADRCLFWPFARGSGGRYATMRHNGKPILVHRRLCREVRGAAPSPAHEATHTCGNGHLACVAQLHLVWNTHRGNMADKVRHGTHNRGVRHPKAKLTEAQVVQIKALLPAQTFTALGNEYGVTAGTIRAIAMGRSWGWLGGP